MSTKKATVNFVVVAVDGNEKGSSFLFPFIFTICAEQCFKNGQCSLQGLKNQARMPIQSCLISNGHDRSRIV